MREKKIEEKELQLSPVCKQVVQDTCTREQRRKISNKIIAETSPNLVKNISLHEVDKAQAG